MVALYDMTRSFATSTDDMMFTAADLSTIEARTPIVHGDRDSLYPVELAVEMSGAKCPSHISRDDHRVSHPTVPANTTAEMKLIRTSGVRRCIGPALPGRLSSCRHPTPEA